MYLSKVKIAGFKSFVDPTVIALPSNLVAVVGPNGCGKSNIIDAVTWVMGESSPKYLRGEALTDVIFNGSSARKPVGQASVELVFDNSDGAIGGEYAKFAEISVKRIINRESDSTYYLNGVRCRKRDAVDLFRGTGLGPRSYSIIGQNMITRLIEAKPEEMRGYLEEAAGISKYKDRRHETELRIQHTKENLARVQDLCVELDKQLSHLKQQANAAEKFKTLKQQERTLRGELYAAQWREYDGCMVNFTVQIQREETALEGRRAELSKTERDTEQLRQEQRVVHDAYQEIQRRYYAVGNEITRAEQDILHHQERQQQWEHDLQQTENQWQGLHEQLTEAEDSIVAATSACETLQPQLAQLHAEVRLGEDDYRAGEQSLQEDQLRWDDFQQLHANTAQTAEVEQTHLKHLEQRIDMLQKRRDQIQQELARVNFYTLENEIETCSRESYSALEVLQDQQQQLAECRQEISHLTAALKESQVQVDKLRNDSQRLRGQQASLEALQQTALGQKDKSVAAWIKQHDLERYARLAQHIQVEKGWELAVEKTLGVCLQAICVEEFTQMAATAARLEKGNLLLFNANTPAASHATAKDAIPLTAKVTAPWSLDSLLAGIYVAESSEEATQLCATLAAHESVVTRDGIWMSKAWIRIMREENPAAGVFQREQELKALTEQLQQIMQTQVELEKNIEQRRERVRLLTEESEELQAAYSQQQTQSAQLNARKKMQEERLLELKKQSERYLREQEEAQQQLQTTEKEYTKAREMWQEALQQLEQQAAQKQTLLAARNQSREQAQSLRENVNQKKEKLHELEIRLQAMKAEKHAAEQSIVRMQQQLAGLDERKANLQTELANMPALESLKKSLSSILDKHVAVESELNAARIGIETLEQENGNLEARRQQAEKEINKHRTALEQLRVELQGWKVKADTVREQMLDAGLQLEEILQQVSPEVTLAEWQAKLDQIGQRITRLGAINLMAIEEYATCSERKDYLNKQVDDLQAGLATLEEAIAKIDRETRTRFKETFEKVNQHFQELFPTIFGGGKAYLELTSDNLLESGVTVMACPPGKRNSSIYLLSGGEKSLTAIALVFSIFQLNPAPFCLLDEVDAALDDANVVRFTRLVKRMADKTQFIFISHNKISIEMGQHLIGVTMNEPGVSRLVSVDIEKAISLAE